MELKKVSSSGDPKLVKANRERIDPLLPSVIAIVVQCISTVYLHSIDAGVKAVSSSAALVVIYIIVTVLLNREHKKPHLDKRQK